MGPGQAGRRRREAQVHLDCVKQLYGAQLVCGARFLRERPASASSRSAGGTRKLLRRPGVHSGVGH
eukprot:14510153-Alexandrium_andersonii.AAC.1